MPHRAIRHSTRLTAVTMLALVVSLVAACDKKPDDVGQPTPAPVQLAPEAYTQAVSAFGKGLDGLDAGDTSGAVESFLRLTELAPGEPAAWANLALARMRVNEMNGAAEALTKARELAPGDSQIRLIEALRQSREGLSDDAVKTLREAVAVDGNNLRARYALVEELSRLGDPASQAEQKTQLEAILTSQPNNLVALVSLARLGAKMADMAMVQQALTKIAEGSSSWDEALRTQLTAAQDAAKTGDARALGQPLARLANLLAPTPAYQRDLQSVASPSAEIGQPVRTFLALPPAVAQPSPPDTALKFEAQPGLAGSKGVWVVPLAQDQPPAIASVVDGKLRIDAATPIDLELPAGFNPNLRHSVATPDWNSDKRPDVVLVGPGGLMIYRQTENGQFEEVTTSTGLDPAVTGGEYSGVWPVDIELDGDLDLVLGAHEDRDVDAEERPAPVLQNNGDGTWTLGKPLADARNLTDLEWSDFDGDGDPDLGVILSPHDLGTSTLLLNERSGNYRAVSGGNAVAVSVADPNHDGLLDMVLLTDGGSTYRMATNDNGATWAPVPVPIDDSGFRDESGSWDGMDWGDLDLNGSADVVLSAPGGTEVLLSHVDGSYQTYVTEASGEWTQGGAREGGGFLLNGTVTALADLDGDGKLDLVGTNADGQATTWTNQGGDKPYGWQVVRPVGEENVEGDQRINSFGVGGQMTLRSGLLTQTQPIVGPTVHFGLGDRDGADSVRVLWPNGVVQAEFDLAANQAVVTTQRLKGSCPWLFADDGSGMKFVTDILWKSPLGLRINAQDTAGVAQTRDWVRVRGDKLRAIDGQYRLNVTAELWETHYFDMVQLMTVDHPAGTEVFVDERFVIPPPEPAVVVTSAVEPVAAARDHTGADVSDTVARRDGRYLDTFKLGRYQGVAEDHWVELDLGPAIDMLTAEATATGRPAPKFTLVGDGWLYPTDSSINVALGQGSHAPPSSLSLEVPDGQGGWIAVRPNQGFPAGKLKTSLFDLSGLDPAGEAAPRQLRLRTNLEIYWDRLGLVEVRDDVKPVVQTLPAATADLRPRGYSVTNWTDPAGKAPRSVPEVPDYDRLAGTAPMWLDLAGFYTRFGDVKPLLSDVEDRYVILNAGDEMAFTFDAPAAPATGQLRDFVFVSDGWEKDGDFNTAYSETVQPLPSHAHPEYADPIETGPVGPLSEDPVYQKYANDWLEYHTRYIAGSRPQRPIAPPSTR
jgi:tetratricopeptide (TPR) repeat protein